ncbi:MAG TPA: penicillin acylase family protein [Gemmatimonadaceae bacterium]|nr:penicillin acylase family protein [Gemmatimonadaceae bacterium]
MKKLLLVLALAAASASCAANAANDDVDRWEKRAQDVTITRDDWGIAHVRGKTDADAVFGMIYAQAEDDFNRVETNYINSMGRLAEAEGEKEIYRDLRMKLFIDPDSMKARYATSPQWLKELMDAWADGLNFYLYKHPEVKPRVISHFEPWMALTFSEGSIGGDIERIDLGDLEAFYGHNPDAAVKSTASGDGPPPEPSGSNGIAIAPSNTKDHHALLLINPHTSFFFRSELQMASDEGLDAYGAVTWGQFFVYQGFNTGAGWMHTSSGVDNIDEYYETISRKGDSLFYKYGNQELPVTTYTIEIPYKTDSGMAQKEFTVYKTRHGPIVREADGKWISVSLMQAPVKALTQSYTRTKAKNYEEFKKTMELHTNSSNNTIFADREGNIAYFHSNFIPKRDTSFDWTEPVDGSNPRTDWNGVLSLDESPDLLNPASGWLYNSNNWPWSAAGPSSPKRSKYPKYVETGDEETPRGYHAVMLLKDKKDFTVESLRAAAYDSYLPAFAKLIPPLLKAYDGTPASSPLKKQLAEQVKLLRDWDFRWGVKSVPTSLAVFWGEAISRNVRDDARKAGMSVNDYIVSKAPAEQLLQALAAASDRLQSDFGNWRTPWGDINRFQRLTGDIVQPFNDSGPSIPVGFTSSRWGSLASFGARPYPGTKKWYGTSGNSFVAVVEFGDSVHAIAITAGGESGHPESPHFNDEAERYATGDLRPVYYYPSQLEGHTERKYHPGG